MKFPSASRFLVLILPLILAAHSAKGQILINEFLASNATVTTDPDFDEYADWIELYNAGSGNVNLNGYYVTDDLETPNKWRISKDVIIPAKGYAILWTDGNNTGLHTSYKIAQEGEEIGLFSPSFALLDSVSFGAQTTDISFGRFPDGSAEWKFFMTPTPGASNSTTAYKDLVFHVPEYSQTGGLYQTGQSVKLSTTMGGTIRYTLDGSVPTSESPVYSSPLSIPSTAVIRSRIFMPGLIPGPVATQSYFINEDFETRNLPVISIATDPANFWDPLRGIYVQDYKPEWEVPVNVELFENNGSDRAAFNERAGAKINGLYAWKLPQKMLGVYFRKQYGSTALGYHLLFDKDRVSFKTFALRASGSDWSYTMFRDGLMQQAVDYNMDIDFIGFRPGVVYVNGEYMGIHNMREKVDKDYIVKNHSIPGDSIDMVEYEEYAEAGDLEAYKEFKALYSRDLSVQSNYDEVAAAMDIENFTDMIITQIYSRNTSISHNVMAWKPRGTGKWKWVLTDLDRGFFNPDERNIFFYLDQEEWPFASLFKNAGYKKYFTKRLADHLYTTFNYRRMLQRINYHQQIIEAEMPRHVERWLGTTSSYGNAMPSMAYWYKEVEKLRYFAEIRPGSLLVNLESYDHSPAAHLCLVSSPANAGSFLFNGLKVPGPVWAGLYPADLETKIEAVTKPGYTFKGWAGNSKTYVIPKKSIWRYLDNGSDQGTNWNSISFDDSGWSSGQAQLGYGDDDEQTTVGYGPSSSNKYITTYFRKKFQLSPSDLSSPVLMIGLLRDDGAIVYINGKEVIRTNMPRSNVNYLTLAISSVSYQAESRYDVYLVDPSYFVAGTNVVAVEMHQEAANSSDISFDLEICTLVPDQKLLLSTSPGLTTSLTGDMAVTALFEATGECIIPDTISQHTTLYENCSPYVVQGDVHVPEDVTLTIEPGVEIRMAPGSSMMIHGNIIAAGTAEKRILIRIHPDYEGQSWGALCFTEATGTTRMNYVTIEDASTGPVPIRDVAAISAYKATLVLDHMMIEKINHNPIAGRYSDITLTNSSLHSEVTGDLINVKYGHAVISNCDFRGNRSPDTDAIDYDDIESGIIRNCRISGLHGFNSDGIDIGEKARHIIIDSVSFYDITDKGISVGQLSTVNVTNCTFVNCNLGLGLKDSCQAFINHCTFYGVGTPVACFEKNRGSAGGNGLVKNSILSNSYTASYSSDTKSTLSVINSISDNDNLPEDVSNLFGNPLFGNPSLFDFAPDAGSPAVNSADDNGIPGTMGSVYWAINGAPPLMITEIFYNALSEPDKHEFIGIYNPSSLSVDLSGYTFTRGITFTFPRGTLLDAGSTIVISKGNIQPLNPGYYPRIYQWTSGSLDNAGEALQLTDSSGIVVDQVIYSPDAPWPYTMDNAGSVLHLKDPSYDNHFGENWSIQDYDNLVSVKPGPGHSSLRIYPNPSAGIITIETTDRSQQEIEIFTITGVKVYSGRAGVNGILTTDLSLYRNQMLVVKAGSEVNRVLIVER